MSQKEDISSIRKEIDEIDEGITQLLEKRMDCVRKIAEYKMKTGMSVFDPLREKAILERISSRVSNSEYRESVKSVYSAILNASRDFQESVMAEGYGMHSAKFGLLGEKLSHSLSPEIHSEIFRKLGINASYNIIEIKPEKLPGVLDELKSRGYIGINVTIPYKKEIMEYLDTLSDEASRIGAVNTVCLKDRYEGYNTDYYGFGMALEKYGIKAAGARCAVLGSGGAARAVVTYLEDHGAGAVTIVSRNPEGAAAKFPGFSCTDIASFSADGFDIIINATPVGMYPDSEKSPIKKEQLKGAGFVMDLIYNPPKTVLLRYAEELGIPCSNGLYMLVAQAVKSEEIWQGRTLDKSFISGIAEKMGDAL